MTVVQVYCLCLYAQFAMLYLDNDKQLLMLERMQLNCLPPMLAHFPPKLHHIPSKLDHFPLGIHHFPPGLDCTLLNSAGSDTARLAPQLWDHVSSNTYQAATQAGNATQGAAPALPPSATKRPCPSAAAYCQLGPLSELRRVPRPRFRLANQRPTATRRSLLDDFDAVEDFSHDGGLHLDVDCSFSASSLIKAHVQPGYHQQQQQQQHVRQWGSQKHGDCGSYQVGWCFCKHSMYWCW